MSRGSLYSNHFWVTEVIGPTLDYFSGRGSDFVIKIWITQFEVISEV